MLLTGNVNRDLIFSVFRLVVAAVIVANGVVAVFSVYCSDLITLKQPDCIHLKPF